jgi:hypothetical protein
MSEPRITFAVGRPRLEMLRVDPDNPMNLTLPAQGPTGKQGLQGVQGPPGIQGQQGAVGLRGAPGDTTQMTLKASAQAATLTGTLTETALATIKVPARAMGTDGRIRVTALWSMPNSANNKTFRVRFGGMSGTAFHQETYGSGVQSSRVVIEIANRGAVNAQVGGPAGYAGVGTNSGAPILSAVNTDADVDVCLTAQLANTGETVKLESYLVELMMPPSQAQVGLYFGGDGILIHPTTFEIKVDRNTVPPKDSPVFDGTPTAPTPVASDNSLKLATTAFVQGLIAGLSTLYLTKDPVAARAALGLGNLALLNVVTWGQIDATLIAAVADYRSGADQKFLTSKAVYDAQAYVPLTDAATIAIDLNAGINFTVTLSTNRMLGFPTSLKIGQSGFIDIVQPAAGGKLLDFAAGYTFDTGTKPVLDTVANRTTSLYYHVRSGGEVRIGMAFVGVRATP